MKTILDRFKEKYGFDPNSEEEVLNALCRNAYWLSCVRNPSIAIQRKAIEKDRFNVKYITDLDPTIQLELVSKHPGLITWIKNPTEETKLAAVSIDGELIKYIANPSEKIQLAAIYNDANCFPSIKNPTEKAKLAAVQVDGIFILGMDNPSEEVQLECMSEPYYQRNISQEILSSQIEKYPSNIFFIDNPNIDVQKKAIYASKFDIEIILACPDYKEFEQEIIDAMTIKDIIE